MKKLFQSYIPTLLCTFSILIGCKTSDQTQKLPACITSRIETLKTQAVQNPPAEIWQWEAKGNIYFYFNAACCDQFNYLYDANCDVVCAPSGGFTGKGDGKCPDFGPDTKRTLIWKDERKANQI